MPRENRHIIFDFKEVYQALYALHLKRTDKRIAAGNITKIEESPEDEERLFFYVSGVNESDRKCLEFSRDFLAAALLLFCRGHGVPISKGARKQITFDNDAKDVILSLKIGEI